MKDKFIIVSGFFASGSSAVVDLLREFKGVYECRAEIRIIKDPYGIKQLEHSLLDDWDVITSAAAISDYLDVSQKWSRRGGGSNPFSRAGLSYSKTINPNYMSITCNYIDRLSKYSYRGDYYHYKFKKSYFRYVSDRMRSGLERASKGSLKIANRENNCFFSKPTKEEFETATKLYFDELFNPFFASGQYSTIILDQALSPNDALLSQRYFSSAKTIIIDRDPRDMFADDLENVMSVDRNTRSHEHAIYYIEKQKAMREKLPLSDENILYVHFESLVLDYENEIKRIMDFLEVDETLHVYKKKYLNPEISSKNVGIWKRHYDECPEVFDMISSNLPNLCFNSELNV